MALRHTVLVFVFAACSSKPAPPTEAELPGLVDRYEQFITKLATATATGDCAAKAAASRPLFAAHAATKRRMREVMATPALRDTFQRLIDARGPKISDPEIALIDVKRACAGQHGFPPLPDNR